MISVKIKLWNLVLGMRITPFQKKMTLTIAGPPDIRLAIFNVVFKNQYLFVMILYSMMWGLCQGHFHDDKMTRGRFFCHLFCDILDLTGVYPDERPFQIICTKLYDETRF